MAETSRPIPASKVARDMLGRSPAWFSLHRAELEAAGFPRPIPVSNLYRAEQVQAWLDGKPAPDPKSTLTLEARVNDWEKCA